ncbi:MAG: hypothetical protein QXD77_00835, partial [Candidatus Aenigmatarchaeota archaeon]
LCFRDTETRELRFGFYDRWKPKEYIMLPEHALKDVKAKLWEGVLLETKNKTRRIRFEGNPKESERTYVKQPELKALEVVLKDYRDRNALVDAIDQHHEKFFVMWPDGRAKRTHEDAFCEDCGMMWQNEYEVETGETVKCTPDGSPITEIKRMSETGKKNRNIGVMAYDMETDVLRWKTVSLSYAAWVPMSRSEGKIVRKAFVPVPDSWDGSAEEFKANYIDRIEDEKAAKDAAELELSLITVCANDIRDFYVRVKNDLEAAMKGWCDVIAGYNNRSYDQTKMYSEMKKCNRLWKEHWCSEEQNLDFLLGEREFKRLADMDLIWRGKGGYKVSLKPAPDESTALSSPFTLNLDAYKLMQRGLGFDLPIMNKRLEDYERLFKMAKHREAELEGLHIWKLHYRPELTAGVLIHNLNDVDSTLYFARRLTDMLMEGEMFAALDAEENGD